MEYFVYNPQCNTVNVFSSKKEVEEFLLNNSHEATLSELLIVEGTRLETNVSVRVPVVIPF